MQELKSKNLSQVQLHEASPTKHQQQAIDKLLRPMYDALKGNAFGPKDRMFCLNGGGGVGKTFSVNHIVKQILEKYPRIEFRLTSLTHKACDVLRKHATYIPEELISTIHSYLALKVTPDYSNGTEHLRPDNSRAKQNPCDILIVDEFSMIDKQLFSYIIGGLSTKYKLVLFVGDEYQIDAVNSSYEIKDKVAITAELTEIVRQKEGSDIIKFSQLVRSCIKKAKEDDNTDLPHITEVIELGKQKFNNKDVIFYDSSGEWLKTFFESEEKFAISYTNKTVDKINESLRRYDYLLKNQEMPNDVQLNEKIIIQSPVLSGTSIVFGTNRELEIIELSEDTSKDGIGLWKVRVKEDVNGSKKFHIVKYESKQLYEKIENNLLVTAKQAPNGKLKSRAWKEYFDFKSLYIPYKFSYAVTFHKSQGSSADETFAKLNDLEYFYNLCETKQQRIAFFRLLYTGITRSRNTLRILY